MQELSVQAHREFDVGAAHVDPQKEPGLRSLRELCENRLRDALFLLFLYGGLVREILDSDGKLLAAARERPDNALVDIEALSVTCALCFGP